MSCATLMLCFSYVCSSHWVILHLFFTRMEGDCFFYEIGFKGENFDPKGPVMKKKTLKWEPSTEKMYVRDGVLKGDVNMALLLEGGGHYRCDFRSDYK